MKRNHHILPRLYLKGFVEQPGQPFIWVYTKGSAFDPGRYVPGKPARFNPELKSIGSPCAEEDYYAYPDFAGGTDFETYENILEEFEKPANPIFTKIRSQVRIDAEEKAVFAFYMTQMHRRVPNYREAMTKLLPSVAATLRPSPEVLRILKWPDTEEAVEAYRKIAIGEAGKAGADVRTHLDCLANSEQSLLPNHLVRMHWRFFVAPPGHAFLTGDNPIFYFTKLGIRNQHSEVSFPISTEIALVASWTENPGGDFVPASSQIVKEINRRTAGFASARLYFSRCKSWAQDLLDKETHRFNPIR